MNLPQWCADRRGGLLHAGCVLALLEMTACGPVIQLAPDAGQVELLPSAPVTLLEDYVSVGTVECTKGHNFRKLQTNLRQCHNVLRNEAAELRGDFVLVTSQALGPGECDNCVLMIGTVYRHKP
jgi:hypothetical protein